MSSKIHKNTLKETFSGLECFLQCVSYAFLVNFIVIIESITINRSFLYTEKLYSSKTQWANIQFGILTFNYKFIPLIYEITVLKESASDIKSQKLFWMSEA